MREKIRSGILGAAVADALGVPVEFRSRQELKADPVTHMTGGGTYQQPEGTWSDDTSMILATMESLESGIEERNLMEHFLDWMMKGEYTPYGEAFAMGNTTKQALLQFHRGKRASDCGGAGKNDNGNGALMRILPMAYYLVGKYGFSNEDAAILTEVHKVSALTHRHVRSQMACGIYVMIAITLLKEGNLNYAIRHGIERACACYQMNKATREELHVFDRITRDKFKSLSEEEIRSTGYVVDTLEAAIWCLLTTNSYKECVLKAVNLGDDTDTVASVAGGLAGIAYGLKGIPTEWLEKLKKREYIEQICDRFTETVFRRSLNLLLPFEDYFAEATRKSCCTPESAEKEKMVYAFAYPEYEEELNEFIQVVENSCFWSYHYIMILNEHGIEHSEELEDAIDTADSSLLCAVLTAYIRQERFHEGLIAAGVEKKVFLRIIRRMKQLYEKEESYAAES